MADIHGGSGSRTGNGHPQKSQSGGKKPLAFHLGGLQNLLKLRTTYRFNERLSGLIGADLNVQQQTGFPVATLQYEVRLNPASIIHKAVSLWAVPRFHILCRSLLRAGIGVHYKPLPKDWQFRNPSVYTRKISAAKLHPKRATLSKVWVVALCLQANDSLSAIGMPSNKFDSQFAALFSFAQV